MKKLVLFSVFGLWLAYASAQSPGVYGKVYQTLNTKCQSASCHSATSSNDGPKFDGDSNQVYAAIFNVPSSTSASSVAKFEKLINPEMPYQSFLLRKVASAANFDTDLALDSTGEGLPMYAVNGDTLSKIEIEWIRQWTRFGALEAYGSTDPQPDYPTIYQYYTDTLLQPFLPKPARPAAGTGFQFRMGPVFLPVTGAVEQEWLEQQVVNFPFQPQITRINGFMNTQSHHFLLFQFVDSISARSPSSNPPAADINNLGQITPSPNGILGTTSFDGNKNLTAAWQNDMDVTLPQGTALMWDQKTYLDFNFHVKNYNATSVLPCDFYFNVYFQPKDPNTIPMISQLVNNSLDLGIFQVSCLQIPPKSLPMGTPYTQNYDDQDNGVGELRYLWMMAGHTHQYGTAYYVIRRDTTGNLADTVYSGQYDYTNHVELGYWDHTHPPVEYWPNLLPVEFGANSSGLTANTTWLSQASCVHFGFTTANEMQLFYYMYTTQVPKALTAVNQVTENPFSFQVQPNPVSDGNGKLVYVLDKPAKVEATVVDITGKTIAKLSEENEQEGAHVVSMDGSAKISAGIYFARLSVNGTFFTKKFVVAE